MKIEPFLLEREQSLWEGRVRFNLAESGVHPLTTRELLHEEEHATLLGQPLVYNPTNGTEQLRAAIARLHPGADLDNVVVCHGTAEANHVCLWRLVEPGDEVVLLVPNYMQVWGLAEGFGARVVPVWLREANRWAPDRDELRRAITSRTRLLAVCNPNNPTGAVLPDEARWEIAALTERHGVWLLADEVYRGAERDGEETPSLWGAHERVLVTGGLSKAYGLPGLRIGWVVGPVPMVAELWGRRDYVTIAPATLSDLLARHALRADVRPRLIERTRRLIRGNDQVLAEWLGPFAGRLEMVPPRAGAIAFLRYGWPLRSTELVERLRAEQDVLVVPGDHFMLDRYVRVGLGNPTEELRAALARVGTFLRSL